MAVARMCPNCGLPLEKIEGNALTPPWGCYQPTCQRAWWPEELTPEANDAWDPATRSFDNPSQFEPEHVKAMRLRTKAGDN